MQGLHPLQWGTSGGGVPTHLRPGPTPLWAGGPTLPSHPGKARGKGGLARRPPHRPLVAQKQAQEVRQVHLYSKGHGTGQHAGKSSVREHHSTPTSTPKVSLWGRGFTTPTNHPASNNGKQTTPQVQPCAKPCQHQPQVHTQVTTRVHTTPVRAPGSGLKYEGLPLGQHTPRYKQRPETYPPYKHACCEEVKGGIHA